MGRPSKFTQAIADIICERLGDGESLRAICLDDGMPSKATVFRWLASDVAFQDQYARARETQADSIFDEILDIADNGSNDWMRKRGEWVENTEVTQRSRMRIDARKWVAGKLRPKKYGDKQQVDTTIGNPDGTPLADRTVIILPANGRE